MANEIEIWFTTSGRKVRLPVLPATVKVDGSAIINSLNVLNKGEVTIFGGKNAMSGEISCFFPNQEYSFLEYAKPAKPKVFVDIFEDWYKKGQDIRLTIPGFVNTLVRLSSFEKEIKDGTGDIYYSLKWQEIVEVRINRLNVGGSGTNNPKPNNTANDKVDTSKQKTHKVVNSDTLWDLAKKYYGKGDDYKKIQNANISKYPSLKDNPSYIMNGWVLVIP